tara:strand:- start:232 stop:474 length:243 start_codon:yes stop_codon:yes gene_type:complete
VNVCPEHHWRVGPDLSPRLCGLGTRGGKAGGFFCYFRRTAFFRPKRGFAVLREHPTGFCSQGCDAINDDTTGWPDKGLTK